MYWISRFPSYLVLQRPGLIVTPPSVRKSKVFSALEKIISSISSMNVFCKENMLILDINGAIFKRNILIFNMNGCYMKRHMLILDLNLYHFQELLISDMNRHTFSRKIQSISSNGEWHCGTGWNFFNIGTLHIINAIVEGAQTISIFSS